MTHFRPYRNTDSPALADLWNRGVPEAAVARPLSGHEFDTHVISRPNFERDGLIVAERDGRIAGFAHAGFGPDDPVGAPLVLNRELGTIAMLVVEPGADEAEIDLGLGLVAESERYLRRTGAKVLYAGGQSPLNPFYWGIYGGSECAGILSTHRSFLRSIARAGFEPVSTTVLLEADLAAPEARDPRSALIRRQARVEVIEDAMPGHWWEALAIGAFRPTKFRLMSKSADRELARATTWDMDWFGRRDGRSRLGLIAVDVDPEFRRKGFGRHLVGEILRLSRAESVAAIAVQTRADNLPALGLYQSLGFTEVETAMLYRLPAGRMERPSS